MDEKGSKGKIRAVLIILAVVMLVSLALSYVIGLFIDDFEEGNVALIKVEGVLVTSGGGFFSDDMAVSEDIVKLIKEADDNPRINAMIIQVNSPGGSAVASDEISREIKKTNKTTVSVIRDMGTSGGYWVASSADHVIANRMSFTGSIGAIMSYIDLSGLLQRYNMSYERLVAGKYKDIGTPFKDLTPEEKAILQGMLDEVHSEFIKEIAENRDMPEEDVRAIATGAFFTGAKAESLGLVDELGGMDEAVEYIEAKLNITAEIAEYDNPVTLSDLLSEILGKQSFSVGEGIGSVFFARNDGGIKV